MGSGLNAWLGGKLETVYGTPVVPDRFWEFNTESLHSALIPVQGAGIRGGGLYPRAQRRVIAGRGAEGTVEMDLPTLGLGTLLKAAVGSSITTPTVLTGTAYQQVHVPGTTLPSLTLQKFVPYAAAGVSGDRFTYHGSMVTSWTIACAAGEIGTLSLEFDCEDEDKNVSAAGTPAFPVSSVFSFRDATLKVGGTATTTLGVTTVSGGASVPVRSATVTGSNSLATARRFFGNQGLKEIPLENSWRSVSGTLAGEFRDSTIYDLYSGNTSAALVLSFVGGLITGSTYETLEVICPAVKFEGETPQVGGAELIDISHPFVSLDDGTNPVVQLRVVSTETAL